MGTTDLTTARTLDTAHDELEAVEGGTKVPDTLCLYVFVSNWQWVCFSVQFQVLFLSNVTYFCLM